MREPARSALAALSFLTAVPVGCADRIGERDLRRAIVLFPAVGAAVGALVATVAWGAGAFVPPFVAATLGVAAGVAATAALHLDGLGDVADAIGASLTGRDPAEAMRDPRLGTFGVAAVALDLLLKVSVVSVLLTDGFPWPLVAAGGLARIAPVALAWRLPYAGAGTGGWTTGAGPGATMAAAAIALAVALPAARLAAAGMCVAVALTTVLLGRWSSRRLRGATGDVFGAAAELGETLSLVAAVALG